MESTAKFTSSIDRDLLRRARIIAAKTDTSIENLFNAELRYLVETFEAGEVSENQNFKLLLEFALGRMNGEAIMDRLGIDSEEDLFLLMAQARLPMPHLPEAVTKSMQDELHALVR
jgi:hypothetical protein